MGNTNKVILYSLITIVSGVSLISAIWLGIENRKIYQLYLDEKKTWVKKNRELEYQLDRLTEKIQKLNDKLQKAENKIHEYEECKREAEEKISQLSQENEKLKQEVSRLVKEKNRIKTVDKKSLNNGFGDNFWSNLLREKANLELKVYSYQRLIDRKDQQINLIQQQKEKVDLALKDLLEKKLEMEKELESTKSILEKLAQDLDREKKEKLVYVKQLQEMEKEKAVLESKVNILKDGNKELEEKITKLKSEIEKMAKEKKNWEERIAMVNQVLEDKMLEVDKLKADLEHALKKIKKVSYVELPKIKIKDQSKLNGEILLSDPQRKYVIINLGRRDGISEGMQFLVYRNSNIIGKIEVQEVREATSAALILVDLPDKPIAEKDRIKIIK